MTTLRKEPTTSPSTRLSQGNTAGWDTAQRMSLIEPLDPCYRGKEGSGRAGRVLSDRLADLEYRKVHRDDHAADQYPEHHHDHRFHEAGERVNGIVHLGFEKVGDLA